MKGRVPASFSAMSRDAGPGRDGVMLMKARERWHCANPACGCQVVVEISGEIEGQNPRCACGGLMKKKYTSPVFTYLDFLRVEEPLAASRGSREG
jgi:hypothetical protein